MMTVEQLNLTKWQRVPESYFADCLLIEHKGCANPDCECRRVEKDSPFGLAHFRLNAHQRKVQDAINRQRRVGKPVRIKILKPRQTGCSTVASANVFHAARFRRGTGMTVSMDNDSSEHIFTIIKKFQEFLPPSEAAFLQTEASSVRELKYREPHGSRIAVETAGKKSAGHSFTIRYLHISEAARWPEGCDDALIGLMNAVPDEPDTMVIIESVAHGMSGWFYDKWHERDDYEAVFLPWFEHDEYQKPLPIPSPQYNAQLEDLEKQLIAKYNLTLEQVEWRRWAIREKCKKDPEVFKEQYPSNASEAFLASGNTFFHVPTIEAIETSDGLKCDLHWIETLAKRKEIRINPNPRGWWEIWKKPQPNHSYVIGADVAEGIEIDGAPADDLHDYSAADILDRDTGEQVACFHARATPDEFGRQLAIAGQFYNNAYVAVENNGGYGQHVLTVMKENEEYPLGQLHIDRNTQKLGWTTTKPNRKPLCSQLDMSIRGKELFVNCPASVREMKSFVVKPDGRIEGGNGAKDDRVFSLAIANKMLEVAPATQNLAGLDKNKLHAQPIRYQPMRSYRERQVSLR